MQTKLLINGEFISGEGRDEVILDPATGKTIVTVPEASPEQINRAVAAASAAFAAWSGYGKDMSMYGSFIEGLNAAGMEIR